MVRAFGRASAISEASRLVLVAGFAFVVGSLALWIPIPWSALGPLAVAGLVTAFSCTGLGIVNASLGLRSRESAFLSNLLYFLLLAAGANVPLDLLPDWLASVSQVLPVTHGVEASREIVAGGSLADAAPLLAAEVLVGLVYAATGLVLVRRFEILARRLARAGVGRVRHAVPPRRPAEATVTS